MEIKFDIPFSCPENIAGYLQKVFHGEYDIPLVFNNPTIIDLGANFGSFSVWAIHRFPGAQVFAYEPHPDTFAGLLDNVKSYPQIKAHNWGIGAPGIRVLSDGANNAGENSFHAAENNPAPTGRHCEVRAPETLPEADILKLDIEGCEMEVLSPLIESGRKYAIIALEYHNNKLRRAVDQLLRDYELIGSEVQNINGRGVVKYLHKEFLR